MSRARRTHLDFGLADLLARTRQMPSGCLEWTQRAAAGRYPVIKIGGKEWYVRRLLWVLTRGRRPRKGFDVTMACECDLCVHPDHLRERQSTTRTKGVPKSVYHRRMTAMAARRRSRLTEEQIAEIRSDARSAVQIAAERGLHVDHVRRIRRCVSWRDFTSPFVGLEERRA